MLLYKIIKKTQKLLESYMYTKMRNKIIFKREPKNTKSYMYTRTLGSNAFSYKKSLTKNTKTPLFLKFGAYSTYFSFKSLFCKEITDTVLPVPIIFLLLYK